MTRSVASATGAGLDDGAPPAASSTRAAKPRVVTEIAARDGRTILFVRTKHGVDRLVKQLRRDGIDAGALHGGKAQNARNRAIAAFRDGQTPVLVATDVAARGIHVDDVSLVVHVDPPADPKDYLHRAGRTARAGESGTVVTMVTPASAARWTGMTRQAGVRARTTDVRAGRARAGRHHRRPHAVGRADVAAAGAEPPRSRVRRRPRAAATTASGPVDREAEHAAPAGGGGGGSRRRRAA